MTAQIPFNPQLTAFVNQFAGIWNRTARQAGRRSPPANQREEIRVTACCPDNIRNIDLASEVRMALRQSGLADLAEYVKVEDVSNPYLPQLLQKADPHDLQWLSAPSFFENKSGFTEEELSRGRYARSASQRHVRISLPVTRLLGHRPLHQHFFQQARGFKTRRGGGGGFNTNILEATNKVKKTTHEEHHLGGIRETLNLSKSENTILELGYEKGLKEGRKQTRVQSTQDDLLRRINRVLAVIFICVILYFAAGVTVKVVSGEMRGVNAVLHPSVDEVNPETVKVRFDDVKGCDEVKEELVDIVNFLKYPEKFNDIGARLPKGVLLVGQPGIGKTLLAKAVAGEAEVPFFQASGSEFDEIFVGTGAKKIRALFEKAKSKAPCVVFIDEIDSVGAKRTNTQIHPYANQTINQLLSEMDGFNTGEGVIVLGATNKVENLDKALLRPGRFDVRIKVNLPDKKGREEIIDLYLGKVKSKDVDVEGLASRTVGFSGAELENMINQAALKAVLDNATEINDEHIEWAKDKIIMGPAKKYKIPDEETNRNTAYHEAGHTLVALYTADATPLHKVTIMPRGDTLGHTAFTPDKDTWNYTKAQLLAEMDVAMGGRVAEELIFGENKVTTGASSDFAKATSIAESMVMSYGMSKEVGLRSVKESEAGKDKVVDEEIRRLLNESYDRAKKVLDEHRSELELLSKALLEYETLALSDVRTLVKTNQLSSLKSLKVKSMAEKGPQNGGGKKGSDKKGSEKNGGEKKGFFGL